MPRNGSGSYSLPEAPFVPLTTISSAAMNSDLSDIATALTGSLARDGQGGMTAVLPLSATGFVYAADTNTGMYRSASDTQAIKCGGNDIVTVTTSGINVSGSITQNGFSGLLVGEIKAYAGSTAPSGWLLSYGQALSRSTYSALFAVIGTTYGSGDGTTTFNIPDLRGRVIAGKDNMGGSAASRLTSDTMSPDGNTLGATGGSQNYALLQANLPAIKPAISITDPGHSHVEQVSSGSSGGQFGVANVNPGSGNVTSSTSTVSSTTGVTAAFTDNLGSGTATPLLQPTILTNYIIYAGV